ncbi:BTB/POZ domain-containing protein 6-B-like [Contarinia nasturtii]|uniref:BTB/POZ domain-containing protein 6-B-like n=1 Tax=Contarinia nasturtii TaxID=265458 RepID=UPI0012D43219|nr:BTB/POZ domain-containing protein 6-B-like [Contarinia nasturtii]
MATVLKNNAASEVNAKLYLNDELADVRFAFSVNGVDQKVPANKANLAALSPVFFSMFYGTLKEGNEVKIVDASAEGFKDFLQFFYLSEVTLKMENIETVVRLADKYDVLGYVDACAMFLKSQLSANNLCWGYQLALFLKNKSFIEFCEKEIIKASEQIL